MPNPPKKVKSRAPGAGRKPGPAKVKLSIMILEATASNLQKKHPALTLNKAAATELDNLA